MNYQRLIYLIPAIIAIIVGFGVMGVLNLEFIITQKNLVLFTGFVAVVAGLWLSASTVILVQRE